ncbi:MAG: CBS domain-containing protein [Chloroflexota bacterium]|mgnify:CR=1 FL=1|nr:CBS domain-containing protein [Chloroflexota bacterium]
MKRHLSQVSDWMTRDPITITSSSTLAVAWDLMQEQGVRRLIVADGEFLGIVTLSDILRVMPLREETSDRETRLLMTTRRVSDVMTYDPVTIDPEDTIQEAAERMLEYEVSGLPVLDGERVAGIITESDIFRLVVESWAEESVSD